MPRIAAPITKAELEAVQPGDKLIAIPVGGVAGLSCIIYPSGKRSYSLFYRTTAGKQRRMTMGQFPTVPLAEVRKRAQRTLNKVAADRDPAKERREARKQTKTEADTVEHVGKRYIELHHRAKGRKSARQVERLLEVEVYPHLGSALLRDVKRKDIVALIYGVAERGQIQANRVLTHIGSLFRWAYSRLRAVCDSIEAGARNHDHRREPATPTRPDRKQDGQRCTSR